MIIIIQSLYSNILGNQGDETGVENWKKLLDNGVSRSDLVVEFIDASLSADLQSEKFAYLSYSQYLDGQKRQDTLTNKIEVSTAYIEKLATLTNITNDQDIRNDPAYLASMNILSLITHDDATKQQTITYLDSIQNDSSAIDDINQSLQITGLSIQSEDWL